VGLATVVAIDGALDRGQVAALLFPEPVERLDVDGPGRPVPGHLGDALRQRERLYSYRTLEHPAGGLFRGLGEVRYSYGRQIVGAQAVRLGIGRQLHDLVRLGEQALFFLVEIRPAQRWPGHDRKFDGHFVGQGKRLAGQQLGQRHQVAHAKRLGGLLAAVEQEDVGEISGDVAIQHVGQAGLRLGEEAHAIFAPHAGDVPQLHQRHPVLRPVQLVEVVHRGVHLGEDQAEIGQLRADVHDVVGGWVGGEQGCPALHLVVDGLHGPGDAVHRPGMGGVLPVAALRLADHKLARPAVGHRRQDVAHGVRFAGAGLADHQPVRVDARIHPGRIGQGQRADMLDRLHQLFAGRRRQQRLHRAGVDAVDVLHRGPGHLGVRLVVWRLVVGLPPAQQQWVKRILGIDHA